MVTHFRVKSFQELVHLILRSTSSSELVPDSLKLVSVVIQALDPVAFPLLEFSYLIQDNGPTLLPFVLLSHFLAKRAPRRKSRTLRVV